VFFCLENQYLFIHRESVEKGNFYTEAVKIKNNKNYPQIIFPHSTGIVENFLQTGVNICGNITNMILQVFVSVFQCGFHFFDGVQNGGVILAEFFTDIRRG